MSFADWLQRTQLQMDSLGIAGGTRAASLALWQGLAQRVGSRVDAANPPTVWERDWDVLILLDACRPDALEAVASDYEFLPSSIKTGQSPASCSKAWMESHFTAAHSDEVAKTAYVTGNVWSRELGTNGLVSPGEFGALSEVWRDNWNEDIGTVPPRPITDAAIETWRTGDCERMIVHYMQPHEPYRSYSDVDRLGAASASQSEYRVTVWDLLRAGDLTPDEAQAAYRDNLRWALDDVALLLNNCAAERAVISADHAELFGKYGLYSHPDVPVRELRRVPWQPVTATDTESYSPDLEGQAEMEINTDDQLNALGYIDA